MAQQGKVVLVTGGSRGIGRGIALEFAQAGARTYITGRHLTGRSDALMGTLQGTAHEVHSKAGPGGGCWPVVCDHDNDDAVQKAIDDIFAKEGKIDVLVNNAFSGADNTADGTLAQTKFWEKDLQHWDKFHRVGLRSHYIASVLCTRKWVANGQKAIILNISSMAGAGYVFDVAYGVGKAGVDRLTADTAKELKPLGIPVVTIWPGAVATEVVTSTMNINKASDHTQGGLFDVLESPQFAGRACVALSGDQDVMRFTGKVLMTPEVATEYGYTDVDGKVPWGKDDLMKMIRKVISAPPSWWTLPKKKSKL